MVALTQAWNEPVRIEQCGREVGSADGVGFGRYEGAYSSHIGPPNGCTNKIIESLRYFAASELIPIVAGHARCESLK